MNIDDIMITNEEITNGEAPAEQPSQGLNITEAQRIIEAVLFAAGHPVSFDKLSELLSMPLREIRVLVANYADIYNDPSFPRGVKLIILGNTCQLCTDEKYKDFIKQALGIRENGNLSQTSLEVLAVIAYNQPVTKAYVEQVRGVDCSYAISSLCDKNLIVKSGKLDVPGKPNLYVTTNDFLRCFGLGSLAELPAIGLSDIPDTASE